MSSFKDSSNIIIENDGPKYYYPGSSYLEKLKHKIPLEYAFELENYLSTFKVEVSVSVTYPRVDCLNSIIELVPLDFETDELDEFDVVPKKRKGKWIPLKKTVTSKFKKNTRRQNGYSDKLFNLEQNTKIADEDEDEDEEMEWNDDDSSCWSSCWCYSTYGSRNYTHRNVRDVEGLL